MKKAIIGGTGVYDIAEDSSSQIVKTEYGEVSVDIVKLHGEEIVFLARHGKAHSTPPHLINYRANLKALELLGVKHIYATCAVGSCNESYAPGEVVILKNFVDFTKARPVTFFEGGQEGVVHTDMSEPYCSNLRKLFQEECKALGIDIKGEAVYVCTEGPRFETEYEIRMFKQLGCDVVGMTNVPEVILAKELGMCYCAVGIITNWCTGIENKEITFQDIQGAMNKNKEMVTKAFINVLLRNINQEKCFCNRSTMKL